MKSLIPLLRTFWVIAAFLSGVGLAAWPERAMAQRPVGIDVSTWQGSIDWPSVKQSGISFAWARASDGTNYIDDTFANNEANAKAAGVLIGAYHHARFDLNTGPSGATAEANYFWNVAKDYITADGSYLMPMLDVEGSVSGYDKNHAVAMGQPMVPDGVQQRRRGRRHHPTGDLCLQLVRQHVVRQHGDAMDTVDSRMAPYQPQAQSAIRRSRLDQPLVHLDRVAVCQQHPDSGHNPLPHERAEHWACGCETYLTGVGPAS